LAIIVIGVGSRLNREVNIADGADEKIAPIAAVGIATPPPAQETSSPGIVENVLAAAKELLARKEEPPAVSPASEQVVRSAVAPGDIRGWYVTGWTAGTPSRFDALLASAKKKNINALVIDVKDYSGYVSYKTGIPEVVAAGAEKELRIGNIDSVIKKAKDQGMYLIARVTVFQDSILTAAHPEWALRDTKTGKNWKDRKGLSWLDPDNKKVWDYHVAIAKDAHRRGFDEINLDYIRFPSDGDLDRAAYPFWDEKSPRRDVLRRFFEYMSTSLPDAILSADMFGIVTVRDDDLGIGQIIEDADGYFDYICPMVYPSHYASGFLGFPNPAARPYEVIDYSMTGAIEKLERNASTTLAGRPRTTRLRPWFQAFDLGAVYNAPMIRDQIRAFDTALGDKAERWDGGWLLWDPRNLYTTYEE
jgi:hypothetical protein